MAAASGPRSCILVFAAFAVWSAQASAQGPSEPLKATADAPEARDQGALDAEASATGSELGGEALTPGVLPALAAVVPGVLVRGSGVFLAGDRVGARRLLWAEGFGLLGFVGGGAMLAASGASRRLVGVSVPVVLAGSALFFTSLAADLYGAITGGRDDHVPRWVPTVTADVGYRHVFDPQFQYRNFAYGRADYRFGGFRLSPSAWVALDEDNQRLSAEVAYRGLGRRPDRPSADGSYLDLASALTRHAYDPEGFVVYTGEFRLDARLDLSHVGPSMRGAFVEGQLGAGLELYDFDVPGLTTLDATGLLLGQFGFGVYFGQDDTHTGELLVYYDHRHDDYAAGLGVEGIGGGFMGHLGLSAHYFFSQNWGATLLSEVGSAYVSGVGVRYRHGRAR